MFIRLLVAIVTTLIGIQAFAQSADDVRIVQSFLRVVQTPKLSIDGAAGSGTNEAAASFLKESGLQYSGNPVAAVRGYLDADRSGMHGVYSGSYRCGQTLTPATVTVFERRGHQLAVFEFGRYGDKSSPFGVYTHYVDKHQKTSSGTKLEFKPRKWVKKPSKYVMVRMKGNLDSQQENLNGKMLHRDCSNFSFTRITSKFSAPKAIAQSDEVASSKSTAKQAKQTAKIEKTVNSTPSGFEGLERVRRLGKGDSAVFEHKLGRRLREVFGDWKEYPELKAASREGDPEASFELAQAMIKSARMYPGPGFNDAIYSQASWWLGVSAKNGNNSALLILAEMVETGQGVEKNIDLAQDMYSYLARIGDDRGKARMASLKQSLEKEAIEAQQEAENRRMGARVQWDRRLGNYETITSAKPYFFEEERDDIEALLPDQAKILVTEDMEADVEKVPGKQATYQSDAFENIVFVKPKSKNSDLYIAQFTSKSSKITYYVLFSLYQITEYQASKAKDELDRFFAGNFYMSPGLFVSERRNCGTRGCVNYKGMAADLAEDYPDAYQFIEFNGQIIRDYDWGKLPLKNLKVLKAHTQRAISLALELIILDKTNQKDIANYQIMQNEIALKQAKIRAQPKEACLNTSVRGRFSKTMNMVGTLTEAVIGSRGSIFPKLKCDGQWCYAINGPGHARISLIPVGTPDCDPITDTTSSCRFSTEFGAGVGGVNLPSDNPIARAIMERAMRNQPLGRGKAVFDLDKCEIIGPMEYRSPEGETFVFN